MKLQQLNNIANAIADLLVPGIDVAIEQSGENLCKVTVAEPGKQQVAISFNRKEVFNLNAPTLAAPRRAEGTTARGSSMPTDGTIKECQKTGRWWSRFHLERNMLHLVFAELHSRGHSKRIEQRVVANRMAALMSLSYNTCCRHIRKAARMGIVKRSLAGSTIMLELPESDSSDEGHTYSAPLECGYSQDEQQGDREITDDTPRELDIDWAHQQEKPAGDPLPTLVPPTAASEKGGQA